MLLGMAGYKSGFLTGEWERRRYRRDRASSAFRSALAACVGVVAYRLAQPISTCLGVFGGFIVRADAVPSPSWRSAMRR